VSLVASEISGPSCKTTNGKLQTANCKTGMGVCACVERNIEILPPIPYKKLFHFFISSFFSGSLVSGGFQPSCLIGLLCVLLCVRFVSVGTSGEVSMPSNACIIGTWTSLPWVHVCMAISDSGRAKRKKKKKKVASRNGITIILIDGIVEHQFFLQFCICICISSLLRYPKVYMYKLI